MTGILRLLRQMPDFIPKQSDLDTLVTYLHQAAQTPGPGARVR